MNNKLWVFDANTLLSALLNEYSVPAKALKIALEAGILIVSAETGTEYFNVFCRPKFEKYLALQTRITFIENIISNAFDVEIKEFVNICRDPRDNKFLSLAISASADAIITGDKDFLILHPFRSIPILSPSVF